MCDILIWWLIVIIFGFFCFSFSLIDNKFVSCFDDGLVKIWDFYRCVEERVFRGNSFLKYIFVFVFNIFFDIGKMLGVFILLLLELIFCIIILFLFLGLFLESNILF